MRKRDYLFLPALLCSATFAWTQVSTDASTGPALPTGPMLRSPGDFAHWEVISTYSDEQKKSKLARRSKKPATEPSVRLQRVVTTKTGQIIHEERTDVRQQTTDVWFAKEGQYTKSGGTSIWYRAGGSGTATEATLPPPPAIGYRNIEIIKKENYVGTVSYNKRPCLVFVPGGYQQLHLNNADDLQKKLKGAEMVAYVDAETRQPVEVRTRNEIRVFQFGTPPTKMQTLPPDLIAQIKMGDEGRARLNQPAPRPD